MKYIDVLNQSADVVAAENNVLIAEEAHLSLQSAILCCKKEMAQKNNRLKSLKKSTSINFTDIIAVENELYLLQRKLNQLDELQKELFG